MIEGNGKKTGKVLVVDDDKDVLLAAKLFLKQHVQLVTTETEPDKILALLEEIRYDVILLDMNFTKDVTSGQEGFDWLKKILDTDPDAVVVLITAFGDIDLSVRAIKAGAFDFIIKPWQNDKLLATVSAAMTLRQSRLQVDSLRSREKQLSADLDQPFHDFIGDCAAVKAVFGMISRVAATDANVLILGANGTGKELAARAVHRQSDRKNDVFIKVDMGAITESLSESELFGHVKGAFTDARNDHAGRFEVATGGTLFLDEIGNIPMAMQVKLLTVLQSRQVFRVGSNVAHPIDIRLICASNASLNEMVNRKEFRQDLLYRINTVEIHLPPLCERGDDIPALAQHFLQMYCRKYRKEISGISGASMTKLKKQSWPGNVRELQHTIERAVILTDSQILQPGDFPTASGAHNTDDLAFDSFDLEEVEKTVIRKVLTKHGGNISHAAEELGLTRTSLYRRMQKHGL